MWNELDWQNRVIGMPGFEMSSHFNEIEEAVRTKEREYVEAVLRLMDECLCYEHYLKFGELYVEKVKAKIMGGINKRLEGFVKHDESGG